MILRSGSENSAGGEPERNQWMRNKDMRAQGSLASALLWRGVHQYTHLRSRWASRLSTSTSPSQPQLYNLNSTASQPELRSLVIPTLHLVRSRLLEWPRQLQPRSPAYDSSCKTSQASSSSKPTAQREGRFTFFVKLPNELKDRYGITSRRKRG